MSRKPQTLALQVFWLLAACGCGGFGAHPPVKLAFTVQPTGAFTGVAMSPVAVTVQDDFGNTVSSASMNITVAIGTNAGNATLSGTTTVAAVGGVAIFSDLTLDTSAAGYTLIASANGFTGATSSPFDVAQDGLVFTVQPTGAFPDVAIGPIAVAVQTADGSTVSSASINVTVALGTNPDGGTLSGTTTVPARDGVAIFTDLSLNKPGVGYTLTASASGVLRATSEPFDVAHDGLVFTLQPTDTLMGEAISPVAVTVQAAEGSIVSSANMNITVALGTNPAGGTLSGTTTVAAVRGVAIFSNLSLDKPGRGYTLTATASDTLAGTSHSFNLIGPPKQLAFAVQPSSSSVGYPISPAVQVVMQDAAGTTLSNANAVVGVAIEQGTGGSVSGILSLAAVNGVATFPDLFVEPPGNYTLIASSTGLGSATSLPFEVSTPTVPLCFSADPPTLSFGNQAMGTTSGPQSFSMTNCGTAAAEITGVQFSPQRAPPIPGDFSETNNCPGILDAGASCTFEVQFSPSGFLDEGAFLGLQLDSQGTPSLRVWLGGNSIAGLSVAVAPDPTGQFGKFVYATNANSNNISMFSINADGTLTHLVPAQVVAGTNPNSMAVEPSGKFAYVANAGSNDISMYGVGAGGNLASLGSPVAAGTLPLSVAVAPDSTGKFGKFAYVANYKSQTVSMYSINADGTLTTLGAISVGWPVSVAVHPSGKFAYVASTGVRSPSGATSVSSFSIDSTTGSLIPTGVEISGYNEPATMAVDPSGVFLVLALQNQGLGFLNIWQPIDPKTGALPGPDLFGAIEFSGAFSVALAYHPTGTLLAYVTSGATECYGICGYNSVVTYAVSGVGIYQTVDAGAAPTSIALDPSGKFAYVGNSGSVNILTYSINADGTLVPLGTIDL